MAFNGSGVYSLPASTVSPAVASTTISETDFNALTADFAAAFNLCFTTDTVSASATELNYNDITTLGTTQASKTVTTDSSNDITMAAGSIIKAFTSTGIDDNATSTALTIDSSENSVFAGTIKSSASSSSATAAAAADDLVVELNGDAGISVLTPDASVGALKFGTASDNVGANISWDYTNDLFNINTSKAGASIALKSGNNTVALTLDSSQNATFAGYVKTESTTVAGLTAAGTAGAGARSFVTDANSTTFNATAVGGGANAMPVVCDGTIWKIG